MLKANYISSKQGRLIFLGSLSYFSLSPALTSESLPQSYSYTISPPKIKDERCIDYNSFDRT